MARIVTDRGLQRLENSYFYSFEMNCGCEIRIDQRTVARGRSDLVELIDAAGRTAEAHVCEVVVHVAPESVRSDRLRNDAARKYIDMWRSIDPPMPVKQDFGGDLMGLYSLPPYITGLDARLPRVAPGAVETELRRRAVMPAEAPETVVRRATRQEFVNPPASAGFKPPEKKPEETKRPDRFDLIEID